VVKVDSKITVQKVDAINHYGGIGTRRLEVDGIVKNPALIYFYLFIVWKFAIWPTLIWPSCKRGHPMKVVYLFIGQPWRIRQKWRFLKALCFACLYVNKIVV